MKQIIVILLFCWTSSMSFSQVGSNIKDVHLGAAINSSLSGIVGTISVAPTFTFYSNGNEVGLGFAIHPFHISSPRIIGIELSYRYYPNGISERFSMFFEVNATYTNSFRDHYYLINNYQTNYNFINFLGGYGFDIKVFKNGYIGTSLNIGLNTSGRKSTDSGAQYNYNMFDQFDLDGAVRIRIGYRF